MKSREVIAYVIAVCMGAAGCAKPAIDAKPAAEATPPTVKVAASIMSAGSWELPSCVSAPDPKLDQIYTLTLGPNFQLRHADAPHGGHREGPHKPIPGHNPTLMDIFTQLSGSTGSQWATVTINLQQHAGKHHLHFRTDGLAVRGGEEKDQKVFCDVTMDPTGQGTPDYDPQWVSFRTHRDSPTAPYYGTYNLGMVVKDENSATSGYELPVFIDPGVDNEG